LKTTLKKFIDSGKFVYLIPILFIVGIIVLATFIGKYPLLMIPILLSSMIIFLIYWVKKKHTSASGNRVRFMLFAISLSSMGLTERVRDHFALYFQDGMQVRNEYIEEETDDNGPIGFYGDVIHYPTLQSEKKYHVVGYIWFGLATIGLVSVIYTIKKENR